MLKGANLAGMSTTRDRVNNDYYATPYEATRAILDKEILEGTILEPACGEGHISEVLKEYYPETKVISTDLVDRGYGIGNIDFLKHKFENKVDNTITNPPFKYAKEFIEKALEITNKKVIMFAKIQLLESENRRELFENYPPKCIYVFSKRINPWRNGSQVDEKGKPWSSTMCFAWFVWEVGYEGETVIKLI
ncbi:MAG TPA: NAD(P)-dependent oxidoreductase [Tissierellaceae bacterium]|nr:NAD(P)-dependent oxidoreductase [Tissierellaceae bacterium]